MLLNIKFSSVRLFPFFGLFIYLFASFIAVSSAELSKYFSTSLIAPIYMYDDFLEAVYINIFNNVKSLDSSIGFIN